MRIQIEPGENGETDLRAPQSWTSPRGHSSSRALSTSAFRCSSSPTTHIRTEYDHCMPLSVTKLLILVRLDWCDSDCWCWCQHWCWLCCCWQLTQFFDSFRPLLLSFWPQLDHSLKPDIQFCDSLTIWREFCGDWLNQRSLTSCPLRLWQCFYLFRRLGPVPPYGRRT